jgi:hypothetical protein
VKRLESIEIGIRSGNDRNVFEVIGSEVIKRKYREERKGRETGKVEGGEDFSDRINTIHRIFGTPFTGS